MQDTTKSKATIKVSPEKFKNKKKLKKLTAETSMTLTQKDE